MKWMLVMLMGCCSLAVAQEPYPSGLSDQVVAPAASETQTGWLLQQQARSTPPAKGELPAQLYVESQKRLADSFQQAIPEQLHEDTRSKN